MKSANLPMALTGGLRRIDEIAFLPAALEIVEAPPSPVGRALSLTLMAAFAAALTWASLGEVDIVASALPDDAALPAMQVVAIKRDAFRAIVDSERDKLKAVPELFAALDAELSEKA